MGKGGVVEIEVLPISFNSSFFFFLPLYHSLNLTFLSRRIVGVGLDHNIIAERHMLLVSGIVKINDRKSRAQMAG